MQNSQFRDHDGWIYINDLVIKREVFLELEPAYLLPEEFIGREYVPGIKHRLYTDRNEIFLNRQWPTGDVYIGKVEEYRNKIKNNIN